jgi:hypothetical protein
MFIAIHTAQHPGQILSTRSMQWRSQLWIWDLRPTLSYWQALSAQKQWSLTTMIRHILDQELSGDYQAVLSRHPWSAVLLCEHMVNQDLKGLLDAHDRFGSHLYREVSWDCWWTSLEQCGIHADATKLKAFKLPVFRQSLRRLQCSVQHVGMRTPWMMQAVGDAAIRRRFGGFIERVWNWSFPKNEQQAAATVDEFPWLSETLQHDYQVSRSLDQPALDWQVIQADLRTDFDRICELLVGKDSGVGSLLRLTSLRWRLNLSPSHVCLDVPIRFRHPHALHRELHAHGTALLQAQYAFEQAYAEFRRQSSEDVMIISWELRVDGLLQAKARAISLFDDDGVEGEQHHLLELENQLPMALIQYDVRHDWSIEESFAVFDCDMARQDDDALPSICALARRRPLFIYDRAKPLEQKSSSSGLWRFCERTMARWWQPGGDEWNALSSDYYRYTDAEHRLLWVSRQADRRWYVHGIFA